jgi:hypothetical protein
MKRLVLVLAAAAVAIALVPPQTARAEILAIRVDPPWVTDGDPTDPYGTLPVVGASTGEFNLERQAPAVHRDADSRPWSSCLRVWRVLALWRLAWARI